MVHVNVMHHWLTSGLKRPLPLVCVAHRDRGRLGGLFSHRALVIAAAVSSQATLSDLRRWRES